MNERTLLNQGHDGRFISKSFGGNTANTSAHLPTTNLKRDFARNSSAKNSSGSSATNSITYRGYLLKRSNVPHRFSSHKKELVLPEPVNIPYLPIMPGMLTVNDNPEQWGQGASAFPEAKQILPLHKTPMTYQTERNRSRGDEFGLTEMEETETNQNFIQQGVNLAAAFFGIAIIPEEFKVSKISSKDSVTTSHRGEPPTMKNNQSTTASRPIKVVSGQMSGNVQIQNVESRQCFQEPLHRYLSTPLVSTVHLENEGNGDVVFSRSPPPTDFVDARDGHIWRAKYCVLEDGILYFYRNTTDGESEEAVTERCQDSLRQGGRTKSRPPSTRSSMKDLSKSPMARDLYKHSDSIDSDESLCMWEKRVALDLVGSVRSAEQEFGANSFELQGIESEQDSDPVDSLVLRARDSETMREWIFQFHRSLASFVRGILDVFGSSGAYLDIEFPMRYTSLGALGHIGSERELPKLISPSPQLGRGSPLSKSLSHGHGRVTVHRRRQDIDRGTTLSVDPKPFFSSTKSGESTYSGATVGTETSPADATFRISAKGSPPNHSLPSQLRQGREMSSQRPTQRVINGAIDRPKRTGRKYIPPHLRQDRYVPAGRQGHDNLRSDHGLQSLAERSTEAPKAIEDSGASSSQRRPQLRSTLPPDSTDDSLNIVGESAEAFKRGGCADPTLVDGSILDPAYILRAASSLSKGPSLAFGSFGEASGIRPEELSLLWETGAVSECGIRDSNEDAFLISHDLLSALQTECDPSSLSAEALSPEIDGPTVAIFAVFDGHCGNQAARFAAERLSGFVRQELMTSLHRNNTEYLEEHSKCTLHAGNVESILGAALMKLDDDFCNICHEGGRDWEAGSTALVVVIVDGWIVVANLGDCRALLCRSAANDAASEEGEWNKLDIVVDKNEEDKDYSSVFTAEKSCIWKEIAKVHKPSEEGEKARIERANGWVTLETEIPIGQLHRMDFLDEDVVGILRRCFGYQYNRRSGDSIKECKAAPQRILEISRVCGELAVSRALGDRDFKAKFNCQRLENHHADTQNIKSWDSPLMLPYPEHHSRLFQGDLVANSPDFQRFRLSGDDVSDEFLLLASDGLWDVLDADDAARVTRDLLFRKKWTAKRAASRLAELAIHLGSSDNITVIVVRLLNPEERPSRS